MRIPESLFEDARHRCRGGKSPDTVDKAVDKAQESGLTDKLAQKGKEKLSGRRGR